VKPDDQDRQSMNMAVAHDVDGSRRGWHIIENLNKQSAAYNKSLYMERNE
jgi:hypothetical protein